MLGAEVRRRTDRRRSGDQRDHCGQQQREFHEDGPSMEPLAGVDEVGVERHVV
jgi:hypothetical protein